MNGKWGEKPESRLKGVGRRAFFFFGGGYSINDLMWFYLLCSFRGTGGLHKTIFLAGSSYRHTFSTAAWPYIHFELQHQRDTGWGKWWEEGWKARRSVSHLYGRSAHDQSFWEAAEAGHSRPGQHGKWLKCTLHLTFVHVVKMIKEFKMSSVIFFSRRTYFKRKHLMSGGVCPLYTLYYQKYLFIHPNDQDQVAWPQV